jgi:toxin ParE1/3/4
LHGSRFTEHALADLAEIRDFIAAENPAAAEAAIRRIVGMLRVVRGHPEAGAPRPRLGRAVRCAVAHPYLAFYERDGDAILVLRIMHGARRINRRSLRAP